MKNREVVTKDNYKGIVLKRMIIVCWILLGICFFVKIFGGNFFNIVCNNEQFIKVCNFIQNTFWYYIVAYITYIIGNFLIFRFVAPELKVRSIKTLLFFVGFIFIWVIKLIITLSGISINPLLFTIIELSLDVLLLFAITKKFWKSVLGIFIMFIFSIITMVIKNLSLTKQVSDNVVITIIYMIDYYIMLILSSLHSKQIYLRRKEMGLFGNGWWLHKPLAELEALLPTLKDEKEIKACQKRIAKLKQKEGK